jgi:hypothetical protein
LGFVGEHGERHLRRNVFQPLHEEVRRTHSRLDRAERVLDRLAAGVHRLRFFVEPALNVFENVLVFPASD